MRIVQETGAPFEREREGGAVAVQESAGLREFVLGDTVAGIDYDGSAYFFHADARRGRLPAMAALYGRQPMTTANRLSESNASSMDQGRV